MEHSIYASKITRKSQRSLNLQPQKQQGHALSNQMAKQKLHHKRSRSPPYYTYRKSPPPHLLNIRRQHVFQTKSKYRKSSLDTRGGLG